MEQGTTARLPNSEIRSELRKAAKVVAMTAIGVLALAFGASWYLGDKHRDTAPPIQQQAVTAKRSVLDITVPELIGRFNAYAEAGGIKRYSLPSEMPELGRNPVFHGLYHRPANAVTIHIEVENATARPFSLSFTGNPTTEREGAELLQVMGAIGATVFGKGENAGALLRECAQAMKETPRQHSAVINGFNVYCSQIPDMGWMAGISLVDAINK